MSSLRAQRSNPETAKTEWIASSQELLAMTGVGFRERTGIEMTGAETLDVARDAIWTIIVVSSPLMIVGLVVGVVVSLLQALTQIQEQTLVFVPKILAIFVTLLLALPFMADSLHGQMMRISSRIIGG
jgi:flagellar biosynthesis protein FliQ